MIKKRRIKVNDEMPKQLKDAIDRKIEYSKALREGDAEKLKDFGIDYTKIEGGIQKLNR